MTGVGYGAGGSEMQGKGSVVRREQWGWGDFQILVLLQDHIQLQPEGSTCQG